jgi:hypothetical protein
LAVGPRGDQKIEVLGDGSGIAIGDLILVFKDSVGKYYTPGGGSGNMGIAKTVNPVTDKDQVPLAIWLKAELDAEPNLLVTGRTPVLATGAIIPANYFAPALKLGTTWVFLPAMYYEFLE